MARRWQHHCIEIREAAQQILLGELGRMGKKGRKQLVESWAQFLPLYTHTEPIAQQLPNATSAQNTPGTPVPPSTEPNVSLSIFSYGYPRYKLIMVINCVNALLSPMILKKKKKR